MSVDCGQGFWPLSRPLSSCSFQCFVTSSKESVCVGQGNVRDSPKTWALLIGVWFPKGIGASKPQLIPPSNHQTWQLTINHWTSSTNSHLLNIILYNFLWSYQHWWFIRTCFFYVTIINSHHQPAAAGEPKPACWSPKEHFAPRPPQTSPAFTKPLEPTIVELYPKVRGRGRPFFMIHYDTPSSFIMLVR